jgi:tetratricopeptide (TPR) repeat protein
MAATYYVWGANLTFRLGDYELANQHAERANALSFKPFAQYGFSVRIQTEALIAMARARLDQRHARQACKIGKFVWKKLKSYEVDCPENFSFKRSMVEAELRSLKKRRHNQSDVQQIVALYEKAVQDAFQQGFTHEAALARELAGDFMHREGNETNAKRYWEQAYRLYRTWGATKKAEQLRSKTGPLEFDGAPVESPVVRD